MVVWPLWFCPTAVVNHFTRGLHTCVRYLSRQKWLAYQIIMSQNPTYETDQERDVPYHNDNMASYRQATTGGAPPQNDGKSYRYATEAIPEDNEDRYPDAADAAFVNAENGQKPSKTSAKAGSGGRSGGGGGCMGQYTTQILVGLVILFAILWIIFLALFINKSVESSNAGAGSAGQTGAVKDTTTPVNTAPTTAAPMVKVDTRVLGMYNGKQVTSYSIMPVDLRISALPEEIWKCPEETKCPEHCYWDASGSIMLPCARICHPPLDDYQEEICDGIRCAEFVASCHIKYVASSTAKPNATDRKVPVASSAPPTVTWTAGGAIASYGKMAVATCVTVVILLSCV